MKVLIIGIDGAPPDFVFKWAKEGYLPNIKKLMENGSYGPLLSTIPPHSSPAWSSFMTGVNPGKHGIYDFGYLTENGEVKVCNSTDIACETIWSILSRNGKKVGIFNVPLTFPPEKVNGFMISGLGTPSLKSDFVHPPELKDELKPFIQDSDLEFGDILSMDDDEILNKGIELSKIKFNIIKYLIKNKKDLDLFMGVFTESDRIGHYLFGHQKNGKDLIREYYIKLDEFIGEIINIIDFNETNALIMSDHGMRSAKRYLSLNNLLNLHGYLRLKNRRINISQSGIKNLLYRLKLSKLRFIIPIEVKNLLKKKIPPQNWLNQLDIHESIAWAFGSFGSIFINPSYSDYDRIREDIIEMLSETKDGDKKVIKNIFRREEIYYGEKLSKLPDLILYPEDGYGFTPHIMGELFKEIDKGKTGRHDKTGIFIGVGPDIKKSTVNSNIMDIAPTILHIFNIPIPKYMDGRVLKEIFKPDSEFAKRKIRYLSYEKEVIRGKVKRLKAKRKI